MCTHHPGNALISSSAAVRSDETALTHKTHANNTAKPRIAPMEINQSINQINESRIVRAEMSMWTLYSHILEALDKAEKGAVLLYAVAKW